MPSSAGFHAPPVPDVRLLDATLAPRLARQLCADLGNLRLDPIVAGFAVLHVPLAGREEIAALLFKGNVTAAVAILRKSIES